MSWGGMTAAAGSPSGWLPYVQVEDVDAYHAELEDRGVEVGEIRDWPWGERSFRVADPDGYLWTFAGS